jgi:hypothetical protein
MVIKMKRCFVLLFFCLFTALLITGCTEDAHESDVDIDWSELSLTMIEAEYTRILSNANDYSDKTIRANGLYYTLEFGNPANRFHYIIVIPGDECCWMGLEFRRDDEYSFPADYPSQNAIIQITGTLRKNEEIGPSYLYIAVDDLLVIDG